MMRGKIENELEELEKSLDERRFYMLVAKVKRSRTLINKHADRIARIDAEIFRRRAKLRLSIAAGSAAMLLLAALAALLFFIAPSFGATLHGLLTILATFLLMTALHPLAHLIAGKLLGIRFLFYFPNGPAKIEPTLKLEYASYLRASPRARAVMHLSGIAASILATLLGFLAAHFTRAPRFATTLLLLLLLLNSALEFSPPLLVKIGFKSLRKSDAYRFFRELTQREEP